MKFLTFLSLGSKWQDRAPRIWLQMLSDLALVPEQSRGLSRLGLQIQAVFVGSFHDASLHYSVNSGILNIYCNYKTNVVS